LSSFVRIVSATAAFVIAALLTGGAKPPIAAARSSGTQASSHALTADDLNSWLDGLMQHAIDSAGVAGGVVVVVKDGEILTERGYGFRDAARMTPMDPDTTLIRPGSISKLFTWTAVMQLVEQGRLDLDADVNRYLDFVIPQMAGKPITLRNIMTHTTGFEESLKDIGSKAAPVALGEFVKTHLPRRVYLPGKTPAYSNYATALAGYIVARVSGQPFEDYIDQHILLPLGMAHSSFRQPVPASLRSLLSNGYRVASEPPGYFEFIGPGPAGALSSTASDMARFMIAHLHNGRYADARILKEDTATLMHAVQPKIYPALNGMALGFYEASRNGHRVLAHNGGTQFFHSDLHLFIADDVGIFICLNSAGIDDAVSRLHDAFFHGFADRYFPPAAAQTQTVVGASAAAEHAQLMAGAWENSRRSASTFMSIAEFLSPMMITANADNTIAVPVPAHGTISWREIQPFVWRQVGGGEQMEALVVDGRPAKLGFGMAPPAAFVPIPGFRSPVWLVPAIAIALTVLLLTAIAWPIRAIARRRLNCASSPMSGRSARVRVLAQAASLMAALVTLSFPVTLAYMSADVSRISRALDGWVYCMELAALITFPAAMAIGSLNVRLVWAERQGWLRRISSVVVLCSFGVLTWAALVLHAMNFNTRY
jgi:CubicO group peptidase (beta-lactamase class C family)